MSPSLFFLLTVALTVAAFVVQAIIRRARRRELSALASDWKMHFCTDDRFQLTARVAEMLPVPGAARVCVSDLIYGNDNDGYRYFFIASFTQGVLRSKRRCVRVGTFREGRRRDCDDATTPLILAPDDRPLADQYRELHSRTTAAQKET